MLLLPHASALRKKKLILHSERFEFVGRIRCHRGHFGGAPDSWVAVGFKI